jgi:hypothetical protein
MVPKQEGTLKPEEFQEEVLQTITRGLKKGASD